jgi:hypothetical protein
MSNLTNGVLPRWTYRYTYLVTKVNQRWARLVLGCVTTQMTRTPSDVRRCSRISLVGSAYIGRGITHSEGLREFVTQYVISQNKCDKKVSNVRK